MINSKLSRCILNRSEKVDYSKFTNHIKELGWRRKYYISIENLDKLSEEFDFCSISCVEE